MHIKSSGLTDVGLKREGNEDSFRIDDTLRLYIVADGMGGHLAGEVASQVAVDTISRSYKKWITEDVAGDELYGAYDQSLTLHGNYILSSTRAANRIIHEMSLAHEQYHGMGTTIVILLVTPTLVIAANAGDSRIYLVRNGRLERLSRDHTIVSEQVERGLMTTADAEISPLKHVLTRNLGSSAEVEPDVFEIEPNNYDRFILCTDGLTDLVNDQEILEMAEQEHDPEILCRRFVEKALQRGGHDNTTVVSLNVSDVVIPKGSLLKKGVHCIADFFLGIKKALGKISHKSDLA
ncbi:MAG: PP2C family protein-serine/threonine phosphatase [Desulfatiglandales bacterium]